MTAKPQKERKLQEKIRTCIAEGKYVLTLHALQRGEERFVSLPQILYVLKNGYEEKQKTSFDSTKNTWKYSIRGKTIMEETDIRVIIAFDCDDMLIITVIRLEKKP